MQRFYIPSPDVHKKVITIQDNRIIHQMNKVLRMRTGDLFSVFDEKGHENVIKVLEIDRRKVLGQMVEAVKRKTEPKLKVSLYQAIPKKTALFELVIQKATELGVDQIFPLVTERTESRRVGKFERLQTIAIEATEQCGRTCVPLIRHPIDLETAIVQMNNAYIAYEFEGDRYLLDYGDTLFDKEAQIIIGPEGGLSDREVDRVKKQGVRPFSLGPRVLRLETAAIVTLGLLFSGSIRSQ